MTIDIKWPGEEFLAPKRNIYDDMFKKLNTANIDPEEFRKAALDLYDKFAGMERDIFSKALSNGNIYAKQVTANLRRMAEYLTTDMKLIDKFNRNIDTVYSTIKEYYGNFKANLKLFKANPCLELASNIDSDLGCIRFDLSEFVLYYFRVILGDKMNIPFEKLFVFDGGCASFYMLTYDIVHVIEKLGAVDPYLLDTATELYDAIEEFLDKTVHLLDKEDGLDTIQNESAKIKEIAKQIEDRLYNEYVFLKPNQS